MWQLLKFIGIATRSLLNAWIIHRPTMFELAPVVEYAASKWLEYGCNKACDSRFACGHLHSSEQTCTAMPDDRRYVRFWFGPLGWSGGTPESQNFMGVRADLLPLDKHVLNLSGPASRVVAHEMAHERQRFCKLRDGKYAMSSWTVLDLELNAERESARTRVSQAFEADRVPGELVTRRTFKSLAFDVIVWTRAISAAIISIKYVRWAALGLVLSLFLTVLLSILMPERQNWWLTRLHVARLSLQLQMQTPAGLLTMLAVGAIFVRRFIYCPLQTAIFIFRHGIFTA